jgi:hypothetical protein
MAMGERRIVCARCGTEFGCGRDSSEGCWCFAETYRLPLPDKDAPYGDCLCPSCLRLLAATLAAAKSSTV